jgi:hypothetical protein
MHDLYGDQQERAALLITSVKCCVKWGKLLFVFGQKKINNVVVVDKTPVDHLSEKDQEGPQDVRVFGFHSVMQAYVSKVGLVVN